jgi:hypothetical protein
MYKTHFLLSTQPKQLHSEALFSWSRIRRDRSNGDRAPNQNPYFNCEGDEGMTKFIAFVGTFRRLLQPKMLKHWKSNVRKSFIEWYETTSQHMAHATEILTDGLKACEKADGASWWD